jgi:hypothetical protein
MAHTERCANASGGTCECSCGGRLHGGSGPFNFSWDAGTTTLCNGTDTESLAVVVFAEFLAEPDVRSAAESILDLFVELGIKLARRSSRSDSRVGRLARLMGEQQRIARTRTAVDGVLAAPSRYSSRLDDPGVLGDDLERVADFVSGWDNLELALILTFPDLTDGPAGHADFVADRFVILGAMLRSCSRRNGSSQPRRDRQSSDAESHSADNEIKRRIQRSIDGLKAEQRDALLGALDANPHLLCGLAATAASVLDLPNSVISSAAESVAERVTDRYLKESNEMAKRLGVDAGALVIAEVISIGLGVQQFHAAAQAARIVAITLCPAPTEHPCVADSTRTFFRNKIEDEAVNHLFNWAASLSTAA